MAEGATRGDPDERRRELRARATQLLALDHFALLGVSRTASADEVRRAYIERVKQWHPDRVPSGLEDLRPTFTEVFARLDAAMNTLADPSRRLQYAGKLAAGGVTSATAAAAAVSPAEAQLELRKAEALAKKNDLAGAEQHARRAVVLDPNGTDGQAFLLGLEAGKPDVDERRLRALAAELDKLVAANERSERALTVRARVRKRLGLEKEAIADFRRVIELNPRNVDAAREVRIHEMRRDRAAAAKPNEAEESGLGGFWKKLFKR